MGKTVILKAIVFLSGFLLFQIELIVAKILLPLYGGSYMVWGACVVFFQAFLLLGYLYIHFILQRIDLKRYLPFHLLVLFLPFLSFPGRALSIAPVEHEGSMALLIFGQLVVTIGPVFFVLSTMSVLIQAWFKVADSPGLKDPYPLYAVSNAGSFVALLSYPFLIEPLFTLSAQMSMWRVGYFLLCLLQTAGMVLIPARDSLKEHKVRLGSSAQFLRWLTLGAASTVLFLAVTNIITSEVVPMPLLWVIPLSIYLLSFTLNFKKNPWCPPWIRNNVAIAIGLSTLFYFLTQRESTPILFSLGFYYLSLFVLCMFCQNELVQNKPDDSRQLTLFYLAIALGSCLGGILTTWIIPCVSTSYVEFLVGLLLLTLAGSTRDFKLGPQGCRFLVYWLVILVLWPLAFKDFNFSALLAIILLSKFIYSHLDKNRTAFIFAQALVIFFSPLLNVLWLDRVDVYRHRNYYGLYTMFDSKGVRVMNHGKTIHGIQYLDKNWRLEPMAYYHRFTPVGEILRSSLFDFKNIGMVGLGSGALASYAHENQIVDFFELDPDVVFMAEKYFTYLKDSRGRLSYTIGDARLALGRIHDKRYDLLIVDAFSGDSVPVHLLTVEAIKIYQNVLNNHGVILFHVSNRYLNLAVPLARTAYETGARVGYKRNPYRNECVLGSTWLAVTWDKSAFEILKGELKWWDVRQDKIMAIRPWTDQYSNLLPFVKFDEFTKELKSF